MFEIKNRIIKITKGDSASLHVDLVMFDGTPYEMQSGDTLTLTVRKIPTSSILMQIVSTNNTITMTPEDTNNLEVGSCCYDIELKTASDEIYTVVGMTDSKLANMVVYSEVTYDE